MCPIVSAKTKSWILDTTGNFVKSMYPIWIATKFKFYSRNCSIAKNKIGFFIGKND